MLVLQFPQLQCETNVVGRPPPNKVLGCIGHGNIQYDYSNLYINSFYFFTFFISLEYYPDMKFVKKFTRPDFLAILKTCKLRLFC